jgi:heterogeneous nuclear ribonucleoprotein A1/A3
LLATKSLLIHNLEAQVLRKTLITFAAAVALGCVPVATNALAASHAGHGGGGGHAHAMGGHAMGGHAMRGHAMGGRAGFARGGHVARYGGYGGGYGYGGPVYDSCSGYGYGPGYGYRGCPGYGVPLVGGVINGILGGYGPY